MRVNTCVATVLYGMARQSATLSTYLMRAPPGYVCADTCIFWLSWTLCRLSHRRVRFKHLQHVHFHVVTLILPAGASSSHHLQSNAQRRATSVLLAPPSAPTLFIYLSLASPFHSDFVRSTVWRWSVVGTRRRHTGSADGQLHMQQGAIINFTGVIVTQLPELATESMVDSEL